MHHQLLRFVLGALFALVALLSAPGIHANSLVNDPFIQQQINKRSFEPGGANHLFGSRGAVADRKGDIHIIPTASIQAGGVNIDQAVIAGYYQYNVKFGGHEHDEHSPFANSNSQDKTNQQAVTGIDFTSLSLKWTGTEVHPADAYDGEQGSGYPAPTGARDEYSYVVSGHAIGARINLDDNRSTQDRLKDRKNAWNDAQNTITNAFELGLTHNPNLNKAGNATESLSALAMGIGATTGIPFEWLGASDAADGIALAKDLVTLEAIRALPHNQKLQVVHGIKAVQGIQNQYGQWRAANPNAAAAVSAVADVAGASFKKGGNSQSVAGDRITGPRGGSATDTGHVNADGQTIYQRDSGSHYSVNPKTGRQQWERSPHSSDGKRRPGDEYRTPSLRKGTKDDIMANYQKTSDGYYKNIKTEKTIEGPVDIGHTYGWENRRLKRAASELGMTQKELNDYVNSRPENFRLENRSQNRSHADEKPGNDDIEDIKQDMQKFLKGD